MQAHERDMATLREDGHEHGHGHGHGGAGGFGYSNRPLDPYRTDDASLNALFKALGSSEEVLDVGGGTGRYALPLATRARKVTVLDPSSDSVELLKSRAAEAGISNITVINEQLEGTNAPVADVALCSLVLHHVLEAESFVSKLQRHATDRVVILEMVETPGAMYAPFYEKVFGLAPAPMPGLAKVMELLWAMDIYPDVEMITPEPIVVDTDRDAALEQLRRRLAIQEGTTQDERLRAAADELLEETPIGITVRGVAPRRQAIIMWRPTRHE